MSQNRVSRILYRKLSLGISATVSAIVLSNLTGFPFLNNSTQPLTQPLTIGSQAQAQTIDPMVWASLEHNLITEHNRVRQNPQSYIPVLEAHLESMNSEGNIPNGCGNNCTLRTQEGKVAVEEAIAFLRNQPAVGALTASPKVSQAAQAHAQDQQEGATGHVGSDGSTTSQRLDRFGVEYSSSGENIAYGSMNAQEVIRDLIIDDGVPDRGHRTNIFRENWTIAGAGCGPHARIDTVCVTNYAQLNRQLQVINNGTVDLLSLNVSGVDILGGPLTSGESRGINIPDQQSCEADLEIQLGDNYSSMDWENLLLCGVTMTLSSDNALSASYE